MIQPRKMNQAMTHPISIRNPLPTCPLYIWPAPQISNESTSARPGDLFAASPSSNNAAAARFRLLPGILLVTWTTVPPGAALTVDVTGGCASLRARNNEPNSGSLFAAAQALPPSGQTKSDSLI